MTTPKLTRAESDALFLTMRPPHSPAAMADARERLILGHLPLAGLLVNKFHAKVKHHSVTRDDLAGVARLTLVNCVDAFKPERGLAFVTYLGASVNMELSGLLASAKWPVYVPRGLALAYSKAKAGKPFGDRHTPMVAVLSALSPRSMPVGHGEGEYEPTSRFEAPDAAAERADEGDADDAARKVALMMRAVTPPERELVARRFGLGGRRAETLSEIGKQQGRSHQAVWKTLVGTFDTMRAAVA